MRDTGITNWKGEEAVASSVFCWLRRTGGLKLRLSAAPSGSDIRVPARALSAAKQGRAERPGAAGSGAKVTGVVAVTPGSTVQIVAAAGGIGDG